MRPIQWPLKNNWRLPESLEKVIPISRSLHPHLKWWLEESNVLQGQPLHPLKHALQLFTDTSKEGWGRSLKRSHCKGNLVPPRKQATHKLPGTKGSLCGPKEVQDLCENNIVLIATDNTTVVAYINKGGGDEIGPSVCLSVENPDLVYQQTGYSQSPTHSRLAECGSRQAIQAKPDNSNSGPSFQRSSRQYATGGTSLR